ncbi:MAG TPA: GNAT family N-acetyltransferase [Victivallales bacterium]|nr:GNAT family N-acetyltransferase [Victivallales bacterium]
MKIKSDNLEIKIRPGTVNDIHLLFSFIQSMAEFENLEVTATEEILKESLFGNNPAAKFFLAYINNTPVAYSVYFFSFSTMTGKRVLWLDDLFVKSEFRGKGIGKDLLAYLAKIAIQNRCGRFEWIVLDWNKSAINLYKKMGAAIMDNWRICRVDEEQLTSIAKQIKLVKDK